MNRIELETDGCLRDDVYSHVRTHPTLHTPMADLEIQIGDTQLTIAFKSKLEMIHFCEKHKFDYKDGRTGVEKYLDNLEMIKKRACFLCNGNDFYCRRCARDVS